MGGQLCVGVGHGIKAAAESFLIKWVKVDSFSAVSLDGNTGGAASDAAWLNNVVKNGVVNCLEGTGTRSLLGSVVDR